MHSIMSQPTKNKLRRVDWTKQERLEISFSVRTNWMVVGVWVNIRRLTLRVPVGA